MKLSPSSAPRTTVHSLFHWPLLLLALLLLLYHTEVTSSLALGPLFGQDFALTDIQIALVTNAPVLFSAFFAVPIAGWADTTRRLRVPLLVTGLLVWAVVTGLRGTAANFWMLLGFCIASGIGLASSAAPASSFLYDLYPARWRSQALGILSAGQALGTFAGFLLPGILTRFLSWRLLYGAFAIGALLLFLPLLRLREPLQEAAALLPGRSWLATLRAGSRAIRDSKGTTIGIGGFAAQSFGIGGIATFLPIFFVRYYARSSADADTLVAIVIVALVFGSVLGGVVDAKVARHYGVGSHTLVAGGATLVLGLLFGLGVILSSFVLFLLLSVVSGLLLGITTAPLLALIGDMVEAQHRNFAYALQVALAALSQLLGGLVVGSLADLLQNLRLALCLFAGLILLVGWWIAAQRLPRQSDSPTRELPRASGVLSPLSPSVWLAPASSLTLSVVDAAAGQTGKTIAVAHLGLGEDQGQALEAAAQALGADTAIWFDSPYGYRILVHPRQTSGWLISHLLPLVGIWSIPIPNRLAGIRLALPAIFDPSYRLPLPETPREP